MKYEHQPVMLAEVIEYLKPAPGGKYIDCTLGGGGYTFSLADRIGESGLVVAIDLDEMAIKNAQGNIKKNQNKNTLPTGRQEKIILIHDNFKNLQAIINGLPEEKKPNNGFDGIVFDLGLSSAQLQDRNRGFSFLVDSPLEMAFGSEDKGQTIKIINEFPEGELARIFTEYGEEKFARQIAKKIIVARQEQKITTTKELVDIIFSAVPKKFQQAKIHPATKVFQALRIATNQELESLKEVLPVAIKLLKSGGRIAVVSFHSLEDRIVKNFFREEAKDCLCPPNFPVCQCGHRASLKIITKKIVVPSLGEIKENPRARSAKLRVAEKI